VWPPEDGSQLPKHVVVNLECIIKIYNTLDHLLVISHLKNNGLKLEPCLIPSLPSAIILVTAIYSALNFTLYLRDALEIIYIVWYAIILTEVLHQIYFHSLKIMHRFLSSYYLCFYIRYWIIRHIIIYKWK
jgi:hypothetical protein